MSYLYVDTSHQTTLGILEEDFSWKEMKSLETSKSSHILHSEIYKLLTNQKINKVLDLKGAFFIVGPGSYTGIRLADGLSQILSWQGLETFTFHHFDIPELMGINKYNWISFAFKEQYFKLERENGKDKISFIDESKAMSISDAYSFQSDNFVNVQSTKKLIESHSQEILAEVLKKKLNKEAYYYRSPEDEFNKSFKL